VTRSLAQFARFLLVLCVAAMLLVTAGVYNVSARAGHWPVTAWFLHFIMRQSARSHSMGLEVPPLEDPRMVIRGATYFAVGCAACHGEPGATFTPIVRYMTPEAPDLAPLIEHWDTHELFWIVDNGIKYTGMPAWAAEHRPDEVWSMVAFLERLPKLDAAAYRRLSFEPAPAPDLEPSLMRLEIDEAGTRALEQCVRCHGDDGMGNGTGAFPYLAGQEQAYLYASLRSYAADRRASGIMQPIAAGLDDAGMRQLAQYFATTTPRLAPATAEMPDADAARGAAIALNGIARKGVPACRHCHGPAQSARNPAFPRLQGQNYDYLLTQLALWRDGVRGGSVYAPLMTEIANGLDDRELRDVAAYYATQPWQAGTGVRAP
jgi:cytochrome c553